MAGVPDCTQLTTNATKLKNVIMQIRYNINGTVVSTEPQHPPQPRALLAAITFFARVSITTLSPLVPLPFPATRDARVDDETVFLPLLATRSFAGGEMRLCAELEAKGTVGAGGRDAKAGSEEGTVGNALSCFTVASSALATADKVAPGLTAPSRSALATRAEGWRDRGRGRVEVRLNAGD